MALDVRAIQTATQLSKKELALLYGVTRQTIHDWENGREAGKYTAPTVRLVTAALKAATTRGVLPLRPMSKHARSQRVASMVKTLQSMKPAYVDL